MLMTLHPGELSSALQRAKVPYTVNFMITTTLQLIPIIQREFGIILSAQKSRAMQAQGFKALLPSIIPVFAGAIDRVSQLSMSLETRAFGANKERTLLRYKPFTIKETTFSLLALLPIILVFYGRINLNSFVPLDGFSLTPFVGLLPLLMDTSMQAQFLNPMAVSLGVGVLFATGITLYLILQTMFVYISDKYLE